MAYRVQILDEALSELRHEARYSTLKWGTAHSRSYMRELKARLRNLGTSYAQHAEHPEIATGVRLLHYKGNRVMFVVDDAHQRVIVFAILAASQDERSDRLIHRLRD